jgi:hypothetical protein
MKSLFLISALIRGSRTNAKISSGTLLKKADHFACCPSPSSNIKS